MDLFGIGSAVKGAMEIYFRSARGTGRTLSMVESVKDGDRIVCINMDDARELERLCAEREVKVECIVIKPRMLGDIFQRGTSEGRTIFDHRWVEERYRLAVEDVARDIDHVERETSGYGAAHRETRRQAAELYKWEMF